MLYCKSFRMSHMSQDNRSLRERWVKRETTQLAKVDHAHTTHSHTLNVETGEDGIGERGEEGRGRG